MLDKPRILSLFLNSFSKFNNTWALMQDSLCIYLSDLLVHVQMKGNTFDKRVHDSSNRMRCSKQRVGPSWALTVSEQSLVYPHQEIVITKKFSNGIYKLDRRQSKVLLTIDKRENKITRSSVFDCHLSPFGRKIAIENSVSNEFRRS